MYVCMLSLYININNMFNEIYENINAVHFTFRTPGKSPQINHLRVFEIIDHSY